VPCHYLNIKKSTINVFEWTTKRKDKKEKVFIEKKKLLLLLKEKMKRKTLMAIRVSTAKYSARKQNFKCVFGIVIKFMIQSFYKKKILKKYYFYFYFF